MFQVTNRQLLTLACCGVLLVQTLASGGFVFACRCATGVGGCCRGEQAATTPACCCCAPQKPARPACCQTKKTELKPCTCWLHPSSEATPFALPSGDGSAPEAPVWQAAADTMPSGTLVSDLERDRRGDHVPISPRLRLQSLLCIWTI